MHFLRVDLYIYMYIHTDGIRVVEIELGDAQKMVQRSALSALTPPTEHGELVL